MPLDAPLHLPSDEVHLWFTAQDELQDPALLARYDALLGMYHDQVLAPYKALSGARGST